MSAVDRFRPRIDLWIRWRYGTLVGMALPFIWVGVALTVRRLRDADWPLGLTLLFFVPLVNLPFFLLLSLVPGRAEASRKTRRPGTLAGIIPESAPGSAAIAVLLTAALAVPVIAVGVSVLRQYGAGLFVGLPFALGLSAALLHGYHRPRSWGSCLFVAFLATVLLSVLLMAFAVEGMICLMMAAPIMLALATLGASVGYILQRRGLPPEAATAALLATLVAVPLLMGAERAAEVEAPLFEVQSSVEVAASPDVVWRSVVSFSDLPPPTEWLFRAGIAPPPMQEWTPYADVRPPHLAGYLAAERGEFRLTPRPSGGTRLEGSTWYRHHMWPAAYWRVWCDAIIHRIHLRVLRHIRHEAEAQQRLAVPALAPNPWRGVVEEGGLGRPGLAFRGGANAFRGEAMLKGFRDFVARGNVVDLAVGVIIGAAFGGIVESLVKDVITPVLGLLGGQPDFSAIKPGGIGLGNFINAIIAFLLKAAGLYFLIVLPFNRFAARLATAPPPPAPPNPQEVLLTEIRDLLVSVAKSKTRDGN